MLSQRELVQNLKERLRIAVLQPPAAAVSSGSRPLDRLLGGGWHAGTLVECFSEGGGGATSLALLAARAVCGPIGGDRDRSPSAQYQEQLRRGPQENLRQQERRTLVVVDGQRRFYPPAAAAWQLDLENLFVVCPANVREHHWAVHQALSCSAVGAVLCWPERLDARMFRRLQLAAETSGSLGLLVRSAEARGKPSWAQVQLGVEGVPSETAPAENRRRLRVELLRSRGSGSGQSVELEVDERGSLYETNSLPVVSELAAAATWQRSAGA
jgi:protein ImuA